MPAPHMMSIPNIHQVWRKWAVERVFVRGLYFRHAPIQNAQKTSFLLEGLHNISESISTTYKDFAKTALFFRLQLELLFSIEYLVITCLQLQRQLFVSIARPRRFDQNAKLRHVKTKKRIPATPRAPALHH